MKIAPLVLALLTLAPQALAVANNPVRSAMVQAEIRNFAVSDATCLAMQIEQYDCYFGTWPLDGFDDGMVQGYTAIAGAFCAAQICPGTTPIIWALDLMAAASLTGPADGADDFNQGWNAAMCGIGQCLMSLEGYTPVAPTASLPDTDGLQPAAHTRLLQ